MKIRLNLGIVGVVLAIGIILGSFYDFQISSLIFSNRNSFGIAITSFALLIGYGIITFAGGVMVRTSLDSQNPKWAKVLLTILGFVSIIVASYYAQNEIFSINGLNKQGIGWSILAWVIAFIIEGLIFFVSFKVSKNYHNDKFWIVALIIWAIVIVSLILGTTLLKNIVHRPRYRTVQLDIEGLSYHNWWEPFKDYKFYITDVITKEEFKSFPSGHAGVSCLGITFAIFLPCIFKMKKKTQIIIFYIGVTYFLLVCFARVLVGAHYLSDVCFGGLLTIIFTYIGYEIAIRAKLIQSK